MCSATFRQEALRHIVHLHLLIGSGFFVPFSAFESSFQLVVLEKLAAKPVPSASVYGVVCGLPLSALMVAKSSSLQSQQRA